MATTNTKERMCESCEEEIATKKHEDLGWVCVDCVQSYKNLDDDETQIDNLSDEEIDNLSYEDECEDENYDVLDEAELSIQGLNITDNDDGYYD